MRRILTASRIRLALLFAAALLAGVPAPSAAQYKGARIDATRVYGGAWLGFGGDAEADGDGHFGGKLKTTVGGQFGLDVIGQRYVSLGMETRIGAVKWKMDERSKMLDFALKPRLRFAFEDAPLELYAAVPVGITVPRFKDADAGGDARVGWNLGVGGGVNLFFTEEFGVNVEPMWLRHRFKTDEGGTLTLKQFALFLNVVLAL